jgi:hypothetical protein
LFERETFSVLLSKRQWTELRAAADRLAAALSDTDEEEIVAEFKQMRRTRKAATR